MAVAVAVAEVAVGGAALTCWGELRVRVLSTARWAANSTRELALSPSLSVST